MAIVVTRFVLLILLFWLPTATSATSLPIAAKIIDKAFLFYASNLDLVSIRKGNLKEINCSLVQYHEDGRLLGCRFSINLFNYTFLESERRSLGELLPASRLPSTTYLHRGHVRYDIRRMGNMSFAFRSGTMQLLTAWGPQLNLRRLGSFHKIHVFENNHPKLLNYDEPCAPYCALTSYVHGLRATRISQSTREHMHKFNVSRYGDTRKYRRDSVAIPSVTKHSRASTPAWKSEICSVCNFGGIVMDCLELYITCRKKKSSSCRHCYSQSYEKDSSSYFCMGLHHVYLDSTTANCPHPQNITDAAIWGYGFADEITDILKKEMNTKDFDVEVYPGNNYNNEKLSRTIRVTDTYISVKITLPVDKKDALSRAIDLAIKLDHMKRHDRQYVAGKKSISQMKCETQGDQYISCLVRIYFKELI